MMGTRTSHVNPDQKAGVVTREPEQVICCNQVTNTHHSLSLPGLPTIRKGQLDKCMTNWRASPGVI
jgi:hypothetical protein